MVKRIIDMKIVLFPVPNQSYFFNLLLKIQLSILIYEKGIIARKRLK
ncbi:hypothetical protein AAJ76_269000979 [Vairimorpha ceranae]|uniref:Uncharacterized protein n=1 Tax=Vairimorpha ceranae TaxID=40302 RepID=A0A0F9W7F5_9MICR|nr:hypothetical protein AAJ76_269000979 [Vairimorpha ceranae]KKO73736.1 hypothetical protein AAJ76_269000979 [Vairimorpha ceranae]